MNPLLNTPLLLSEPVFNQLANLTPEALEAMRSNRMDRTWTVKRRGSIAVMEIHGAIARYDSFMLWVRGGTALEDAAPDLKAALDDPNITSIVLDIDSPGGETAGIFEFAEMIRAANKKVVAYVGNQAASAALWIAAAADEIIVSRTAELGSLGVVFGYRKSDSAVVEIVSAVSPKKRLDPATDEGRADIQQRADDLAEIFVAQVAAYRGVKADKVKSDFGQGGMMIAEKAIAVGMADKYGSLEGVITSLQAGANTNFYGGTVMGLTTELRALVAGKADADVEAAFASIGFTPATSGSNPDKEEIEEIKKAAHEAGKKEGLKLGKEETLTAEKTRVSAVMEKCQIAKVTSAKFISETLAMTPEEAGKKIIDSQADASMAAEIFSTIKPTTGSGGDNPLLADAKRRAEGK